MHCDENPFLCQCEKEDKTAEGFQISHFYWSFSSDIALKELSGRVFLGDDDPKSYFSFPASVTLIQ